MNKINFTREHESRLRTLALEMLFSGAYVQGIGGAKYTIHDLLHDVTLNTLSTMFSNLTKEVEKLENVSEWDMNDYQQRKLAQSKSMREFINLLIGYRKYQVQKDNDKALAKELRAKIKELESSSKTPQQQIDELKASLKDKGFDPDSEDEE